jgi:hypothetical protein
LSNIWRMPPKEERTTQRTAGARTFAPEPWAVATALIVLVLLIAAVAVLVALAVG